MPHEKCGKEGCNKKVGHGRHFPGPEYYCECGFHSPRMWGKGGLKEHLKQARRELEQQTLIFGK